MPRAFHPSRQGDFTWIQQRPAATHGRRGFTLIELLVVLAIIALLMAMLLPVLGSVRKTAKATICMSNMRQLAIATTSYTVDHRDYLPQPSHDKDIGNAEREGHAVWFNALDYYLQQQLKNYATNDTVERNYESFKQDPSWLDLPESGVSPNRSEVRTIKMNKYLGHIGSPPTTEPFSMPGTVRFFRVTDISKPSSTVLYVDGRGHDTPSVTTGNIDGDHFGATPGFVGLRHEDGANVTKTDGSVHHHENPIYQSFAGYQGWFTENNSNPPDLWPDVTFNFRPEDF